MRFWHEDQELRDFDITPKETTSGLQLLHGSAEIGRLLYATADARFAQYRQSCAELTLATAANMAVNYIRACGDPVSQKIDAGVCLGIGGQIHIATVTPNGFSWFPGFEPGSL
jgi:hypothetical protein